MLEYESSDDESKEVYAAEFTWSSDVSGTALGVPLNNGETLT
jgi:hypothetical protein